MDDRSASDQPGTSTTIMRIWMLTGIILVSGAFFAAPYSRPWMSLNAAGAVAGLYLIALLFYVARKPLRLLYRLVVICIGLLVLGVTAFSWIQSQSYIKEQRESLALIRTEGARGGLYSGMSAELLRTLRQYYEPKRGPRQNLREIFVDRFGPAAVGQPVPSPLKVAYHDYTAYIFRVRKVYLQALEPDKIVLVGVDAAGQGRVQSFKNIDGHSGAVQEKVTLTPKGIVRESEN